MKKLFYIAVIIAIQHLTLSIQNATAQAPISTPDNTGAGNCLSFDGTSDYVEVADDNSLDITNAITISAWIMLDNTSGVQGIVSKYDSGPGDESYSLSMTSAGDEFQLFVTSTGAGWPYTYIASDNVNFQTNRWYHVAGTYNSVGTDNIHLFVNGEEVAGTITNNDGGAGTIEVTTVPVLIGGFYEPPITPHRPFDGKIDEVRIWNVARSESQIQQDMCKKLTGSESNLAAYWNMNDATSTSDTNVDDLTSNGNDGTRK